MQFLAYYPIIQSFKIKLNLVFLLCWPNIFNNNNNNRVAKNLESGFSSIVFAYNSSKKKIPNFFPGSHEFSNYPFLSVFGPIFFAMISVEITQNHPVNFKQKQVNNTRDILHNYFPFLRHEKKREEWACDTHFILLPTLKSSKRHLFTQDHTQ